MPFDPKAFLNEPPPKSAGFDPKAYLAEGEHGMDVMDPAGIADAYLEHAGNALTMGYAPQLSGAAGKAMFAVADPAAKVDADLAAQGFKVNDAAPGYVQLRDDYNKRKAQQEEDHPVASGLGTVTGIVAGGKVMGGLQGASPATLGGRVLQGAKTGALMGGAANPGDTEGELDPIQYDRRLHNAKFGAVVGGAIPLALQGVQSGASAVSDYLGNKAALKAARSLGRPTPTQAAQMAQTGQDAEIGRTLLDQGAIPVLGTPSRISSRVDALKEKVGQSISYLIKSGGDNKTIDAEKLGMEILDSPELAAMRKTPGMENTVSAIEKQVDTLAKNGTMTLGEAQALRQGIDKSINFNKAAPDMRGAQEGLYQQRTAIRDAMNDAINGMNPSAGKDALLNANRGYSNLSKASDILEREMGRNQANRGVSLTDTIAGAAGLAHGGPLGAAVLGGLNKFGRTFGNSIQARGYDAAAKALPYVAQSAGAVAENPTMAQRVAQAIATPAQNHDAPEPEQPIDQQTLGIFKANPGLIDQVTNPELKAILQKQLGRMPAKQRQNYSDGGLVIRVPDNKGQPTDAQIASAAGLAIDDKGKQAPRKGYADGGVVTGPGTPLGDISKGFDGPSSLTAAIKSLANKIKGKDKSNDPQNYRSGGVVPGRARVPGNSVKNDTVKANLSPGEIVVPRSKASNPHAAAEFAARQSLKGEAKWIHAGLINLGISDPNHQQALMASPAYRHLLIQASDLKPGSKAYSNVMKQIQSALKGAAK